MQIQHGFEDSAAYRRGYLSIGNFDGVHRGHQQMLHALVAAAREAAVPAVVMTFEPHPLNLLAPDRAPPRLTTPERKAELIAWCGVDCLVQYPTDAALLQLTPRAFFERIIREEFAALGMVEGPNFCFGRGRAGTVATLRELCDGAGMRLLIIDAVARGDVLVSSSGIRRAIAAGRIGEAVAMLGHPYRLSGVVERGAGRGQSIGFATANLHEVPVLIPADGVYAAVATLGDQRYPAAVHVGPNPTFGEGGRKLEVHLIGYAGGPLYGTRLSADLVDRIRDTMRFAGVEVLRGQLEEDVRRAAELARPYLAEVVSTSQSTRDRAP